VGSTTTANALAGGQCVPSDDGITSQYVSYGFFSGPPYNISSAYYQSSNSCQGPAAYNFWPSENVSNCTRTNIFVAPDDKGGYQFLLSAYIAATCINTTAPVNHNSILALLAGRE